ncbi:CHASE2 domain-containing protein [Synechococcus sp. CBW1108]|uniref:CHASE2 domain-containing protein n=1 Tax=Synechococcus sp. CBW1108 TaxID=1353147 RepID=UPI0018CFA797|nr:CHASE2 domain-containing protein [Synechococcus sp. CBW1108]QPN70011.1 CHASE2 domain-containing protein [Synechococcus sp. CBW1108]
MGARIDLLIRQAVDGSGQLQVFLAAPGRQDAFVVPIPRELLTLQRVWRQRFLKHHDPAFAWPEGAAVVRSYSEQLRQGLQQWIDSSAWLPLQRLLKDLPDLPLSLRLEGVDETFGSLPWESLALGRPIWRLDGDAPVAGSSAPVRARKPRILLLVGSEAGLHLDGEVGRLQAQQRSGRIHLSVLRGQGFNPAALRTALAQGAGWDALLYLGHSSGGPNGGVLHLGDGSQLDGQALEADLAVAASHGLRVLLFNSCSGLQLAQHAARAGIDWAVCFLEPVPSAAAALAFAQLLKRLEAGSDLQAAVIHTRQMLAERKGCEGCELLLAAVATPIAKPFQLPLQRRRQLLLRLASTKRKQAIAAGAFVAAALVMEFTPANPLNSYLLDRRLEVQRLWRQLTRQPGPGAASPITVLLLDPATTLPELGGGAVVDHTSRVALAEVLHKTPPAQVPVVGLDVVFDQPRPGTDLLAAVLRRQPGRKVVGGFVPQLGAPCQGQSGNFWLESSPLAAAGLIGKSLAVGTAGSCGVLKSLPLHLLYAITSDNFAGALSKQSVPVLPADRVIDWSLNWAEQIRLVQPAELPQLKAPVLLVGTSGRLGNQSEDLFEAPATVQDALLRGDQPLWNGNAREVPGVLVQAVLIQSLNLQHWLTPLSQTLCTAAAAALGVVLAALLEKRQHRWTAVALLVLVCSPLAWSLAIWQLWLVPLLLPLLALSATASCRDD